jgi:hypothetical protein
VGDGCAAIPAAARGGVVLAEIGGCGPAAKARAAGAAGAGAVLLIQPGAAITPALDEAGVLAPVIGIGADDGARLRALAVSGARVTLPSARPWGGVRVWDIHDPAHPSLKALYRTDDAQRFPPPGPGYYTAHNPLSAGRYALISWYSDGVRLLDLADPGRPREVASFVPPALPDPQGFFPTAPLVWGVARAGDLVLASDINSGLYVLRATGIDAS